MLRLLMYISLCIGSLNAVLYDCLSGSPANETQIKIYEKRNNTGTCTVDIKSCDPEEWRRVDGSCNNLKFPSRGTQRTPTIRLLPHEFSHNYEPRKTEDGNELPLARELRWELLQTGRVNDLKVTQLASYYMLSYNADIMSLHDVLNYVMNIRHCCLPEGKKDNMCSPIPVPLNDPVHRFSGITCLSLTRPESFQSYNCTEPGTTFSRVVYATPVFDLSHTYDYMPGNIDSLRTYRHGKLKIENDNGILLPPSDPNSILCGLNERPRESRCFKYHANPSLGSSLLNILFYRFHNHIAEKLRKLNPHWDDDRLFYTARDINIAVSIKIYLYDLLSIFLGKKNMVREGLISESESFRDMYDESIPTQVTDEYVYIQRWFHTVQETKLRFYDKDGYFVKTYPLVNCSARTGFFTVDDNMELATQGSFRQLGGGFDHTIDVDMVEKALGGLQSVTDVTSNDVTKGRLFGFASYVKYKEYCEGRPIRRFSDLKRDISPERLNRLREVYQHPNDIDLIAGTWVENHVKGGRVPKTVYCLMVEQLQRTIRSDRHWFERSDRPHAFTLEQLKAVRRTTVAGLLCAVGDSVTEVQLNAFYTASPENPFTECSAPEMGNLDLSSWKDLQCS